MTATVLGLDGGTVDLGDEAIQNLRMQVRGQVLAPEDPGYDQVRGAFNAMYPGHPALVVQCSGTADVVDAVNFAREHRLLVTVRGGGHSIAGLSSTDGGMLIDLATMHGVQVDPDRRLAYVQGGAVWGDVDREAQAFGLVTPGGVISDTGVGGLTLGGGYGWVRRKYGLSCDNVIEAQVVCADGQVRTASADANPDLYWAIRGGGGNFGIVTALTFRLHPHGPIVAFAGVMYPAGGGRRHAGRPSPPFDHDVLWRAAHDHLPRQGHRGGPTAVTASGCGGLCSHTGWRRERRLAAEAKG